MATYLAIKIINGIPQGSVMSVTLFFIALNDIKETIHKPIKYTIYAEDCTVFTTGKNLHTSQQILQEILNNLQDFSLQTSLKFSKIKTTATLFSKKKTDQNHQPSLYLGNHKLQTEPFPKILGLRFDRKHLVTPSSKILKVNATAD